MYRVRSRALALLQATSTVEEFRAVARAEVAKTIGSYAAVLAALTGLVVFVFPHGAAPPFVLSVCAYGVLGLVLFCGTILLSLGRHWLALGLTGAALAVDSTMRMLIAPASPESLAAMHFVVFMCLLGIMVVALGYRYTRAGAHR